MNFSNDSESKADRSPRRRITTIAVAGGIVVVAGVTAFGATAAMAAGSATPSPSSSAAAPPHGPKGEIGGPGPGIGPEGLGQTIQSVSSTSLKVETVGGSTKTYTLSDATKVALAGLKSGQTTSIDAVSDLAVGQRVQVTTTSSSSTAATKVTVEEAHLDGTVLSVSGTSFTLRDREGFTRSVTLAADAVVTKSGASSTSGAIVVGQQVQASGLVASDGTTMTAESANVGTPTHPEPAVGPKPGPVAGHERAPRPAKG